MKTATRTYAPTTATTVRVVVEPGWEIRHLGHTVPTGRTVRLDDRAAQRLLKLGAVKRSRWWQ